MRRVASLVGHRQSHSIADLAVITHATGSEHGDAAHLVAAIRIRPTRMNRRRTGRATRQILSGSQLTPSQESLGGRPQDGEPLSVTYWYLVALAILIVLSAVVWVIWGMGPASVILLLLAIGLIGSWLVL
jgi:hypothetical protein